MPGVGLEPTIPAFERAKTDHALDRTVTVIGLTFYYSSETWMKYIDQKFFITIQYYYRAGCRLSFPEIRMLNISKTVCNNI
jgi:hypothetical protein